MYQELLTNDCLVMFDTTQSLVMSTGSVHRHYQELQETDVPGVPGIVDKNRLGNVWYRAIAGSVEVFCSFDINRHSLSCFCGLTLETVPFAKMAF